MATAKERTSFEIPKFGTVTLDKGETCPPQWEEFAPEGALEGDSKTAPKRIEKGSKSDADAK